MGRNSHKVYALLDKPQNLSLYLHGDGHDTVDSVRDGMIYVADLLKETIPELDVRYIECGEVYTYTD